MDSMETDWGDPWPLSENGFLETDTKPEVINDDQLVQSQGQTQDTGEYKLYEDYDDEGSESGHTEDDDDGDQEFGISETESHFVKTENETFSQPQIREGMVMCEFCGKLGVRDAFYSKTKRFCSVTCSKSYSSAQKDGKPTPYSLMRASLGQLPQLPRPTSMPKKNLTQALRANKTPSGNYKSFDWNGYLDRTSAVAVPVNCFKHSVMADSWANISVEMKVEVINTNSDLPITVYWIATVIKVAGYKAQMRYEGFGNDPTMDFWINLCIKDVHPVGWCAANAKQLVPPKAIQHKYSDWKEFLVKRLTGSRTLPHNFYEKLQATLSSTPVKEGMKVEVVDKLCVSAMRVAKAKQVRGGRLKLHYVDAKVENDEFWCHYRSPLVHPVGWSQLVGHKVHASAEYRATTVNKVATQEFDPDDSTPDMFPRIKELQTNGMKFQRGMKLEAIDPLNLSAICVGTVTKVLKNNYLMIGIDGSMAQNGSDWFCYHAASPCIFPAGFCEINNIPLMPPRGYKGPFKWYDYLKQTKAPAAPVQLFNKDIPKQVFRVGMKLEAVDLMEPRLICVATVSQVVGRLLRVHFDGWDDSYDQWVDCRSPDIYPVGWCEMVGFHLEGPRPKETIIAQPTYQHVSKKRKPKGQIYRGPRKKRKPKTQPGMGGSPGGRPLGISRLLSRQSSIDSSDVSSQDCFMFPESSGVPRLSSDPSTSNRSLPELSVNTDAAGGVDASAPATGSQAGISLPPPLSPPPQSKVDTKLLSNQATPPMPVLSSDSFELRMAPKPPTIGILQPPQLVASSPPVPPKSSLASSMTNIASMLNSPVRTSAPMAVPLGSKLLPSRSPEKKSSSLQPPPPPPPPPPPCPSSSAAAAGDAGQGHMFSISPSKDSDGTLDSLSPPPGLAHVVSHTIPRVIPGEAEKDAGPAVFGKMGPVSPQLWTVFDVCQFLRTNDCGAHCDSFRKKNIDGQKFMCLTKEQIVNLTGMKVGPSLKIYDLIQALKMRVAQQKQKLMPTPPQPPQPVGSSAGTSLAAPTATPTHSLALKTQLTS